MKQMKLNSKITLTVITIAIMATGGFHAFTSQQPALKNKTTLTNYIEGFEENTLITLTSLSKENITEEKIEILNTKKTPLSFSKPGSPKNFILNIKYKNKNFDITATQNKNATMLKFEGAPLDTKISILINENKIHQNVPVDWAGNLTLTQDHKDTSLCAIINNKEKICYNTDKGSAT